MRSPKKIAGQKRNKLQNHSTTGQNNDYYGFEPASLGGDSTLAFYCT
jgi:hypothetical protein